MFKKVCIIGCGLIGSSIARGIKKNKLATKVVSSNRSNSTNKKVIRLKIVNEASSDTKKIVKGSDLIIIASPLSSYKNIILKIKSSLKNGAILTDVGSVKKNVISLIEKNIPKNVSWISSHPIAGTEESGPESGFSELFKNRWCILTPSKKSKSKDVKLLEKFWQKLGSKVDIMNAKQLKEQGIDVNKLIPVDLTNKGERATIEIKKSGFWSAMKKQKHYRLR